jgi:hypothetical protein
MVAGLFHRLKTNGVRAEMVPELIKYKVYDGVDFTRTGFDISNTLEQQKLEEIFDKALRNGDIDVALCEAPLCNGFFYATFYGKDLEVSVLKAITEKAMKSYDKFLLVQRPDEADYQEFGRHESKGKSAMLHDHIRRRLGHLGVSDRVVVASAFDAPAKVAELLGIEKDAKTAGNSAGVVI